MYEVVADDKTKGGTDYADVAKGNSEIEENIGLSLATNGKVSELAKAIMKNSGVQEIPKGNVDRTKLGEHGGAQSVQDDWDTLGGTIFQTMEEIEKNKPKYSTSTTAGHPYFPSIDVSDNSVGVKKPDFDKGLNTCSWDELPLHTQGFLRGSNPTVDYNQLSPDTKLNLLHDYRHSSPAAQATATKLTDRLGDDNSLGDIQPIVAQFKGADEAKAKQLKETLKVEILKVKATSSDDVKAKLGALLDIVVDSHTSGDHTNMVKRGQNPVTGNPEKPGNPNEDIWINDTVAAGKPIISGPSGHTLRYLNFWAEKRNATMGEPAVSGRVAGWPSLQAARLVMMADLMPPKHHSYDEIMTSSIGIKDKASTALMYNHKSSYLDLVTQNEPDAKDIALTAYKESKAYTVKTDLALDAESLGKNADAPASSPVGKASIDNQKGLVDNALEVLRELQKDPQLSEDIGRTIEALTEERVKLDTPTTPSAQPS